jgi:hypothetical protein
MIDWNRVKIESIEAVNEIIDNGANTTSVILVGEYNKDLSGLTTENWMSLCDFYLNNYKLACANLNEECSTELISKAENFIE